MPVRFGFAGVVAGVAALDALDDAPHLGSDAQVALAKAEGLVAEHLVVIRLQKVRIAVGKPFNVGRRKANAEDATATGFVEVKCARKGRDERQVRIAGVKRSTRSPRRLIEVQRALELEVEIHIGLMHAGQDR